MFYNLELLKRGGKYYFLWTAATRGVKQIRPRDINFVDITSACDDIIKLVISDSNNPLHRMSLTMSVKLIHGAVLIHQKQVEMLFKAAYSFIKVVRTPLIFEITDDKENQEPKRKRTPKPKRVTITHTTIEDPTGEQLTRTLDENQSLYQELSLMEMFQVPPGRAEEVTLKEVSENVLRDVSNRMRLSQIEENIGEFDDVQFIRDIEKNLTTEEETNYPKKRQAPADEIAVLRKIPKIQVVDSVERQAEKKSCESQAEKKSAERPAEIPLASFEARENVPPEQETPVLQSGRRVVAPKRPRLSTPTKYFNISLDKKKRNRKIYQTNEIDEDFHEESLLVICVLRNVDAILAKYGIENEKSPARDQEIQDDAAVSFHPQLQSTPLIPRGAGRTSENLEISAVPLAQHSISTLQVTPLPMDQASPSLQLGHTPEERVLEKIAEPVDPMNTMPPPVLPEEIEQSNLFLDTIPFTLPTGIQTERLSLSIQDIEDEYLMDLATKVLNATQTLGIVTIDDVADTPLTKRTIARAFMGLLELHKSSHVVLYLAIDGISLGCIKLGLKLQY